MRSVSHSIIMSQLGFDAEQPDGAGHEGQIVGDDRTPEQRLRDAGAREILRRAGSRRAPPRRRRPTSMATFSPAFRTSAARSSSDSAGSDARRL